MQKIDLNGKNILVTGSPGFIGANLVIHLLKELSSGTIVSLDNMNDYYEVSLKEWRLQQIERLSDHTPVKHIFVKGSIADKSLIDQLFSEYSFDVVVNLAAQAGVSYSLDHPDVFMESNIIGFYNILEACRHYPVEHLVYASSPYVFGADKKVSLWTNDKEDNPVNIYAAALKSNELLAHKYSKLYNIPTTCLRFFYVYGAAGRPDMYYYRAAKRLTAGKELLIYIYGDIHRDFIYINDLVEGIYRVMQGAPDKITGKDGLTVSPYDVYNMGSGKPASLLDYICILQEELVRAGVLPADYDFKEHRRYFHLKDDDIPVECAHIAALKKDYGFTPKIGIREGLRAFAQWYAWYYKDRKEEMTLLPDWLENKESERNRRYKGKIYKRFNVDIVFCIDASRGMDPILKTLQENISHFYKDIKYMLDYRWRVIYSLRARFVLFRDYLTCGREAMLITDFFDLPEQSALLDKCIHSVNAKGVTIHMSDGLEALAYAIRSPWNYSLPKRRHIIVLLSDRGANELGYGKSAKNYPRGMAENFGELSEWWGSKNESGVMNDNAKRLIMYTPDIEPWKSIYQKWNNVLYNECDRGEGCSEITYEMLLKTIACSI